MTAEPLAYPGSSTPPARAVAATAPATLGAPERDASILDAVAVIWRRRGMVIGTVLVLLALLVPIIFQLTPYYSATATVMIGGREQQVVDVESVLAGLPSDLQTIESEIQVIRSRGLLEKAVHQLDLLSYPEFNKSLQGPSAVPSLDGLLGLLPDGLRFLLVGEPPADLAAPDPEQPYQEAVNVLREKLVIQQVGVSRVVAVTVQDEKPRLAQSIANRIADLYVVSQLEAKFAATERANRWIAERLEELRIRVLDSEAAVERYRSEAGLTRGTEATLITQQISQLNSQMVTERTRRAEAEARLAQVEALVRTGGAASASEVLQSPLITRLREQEAEVVREAGELSQEYGDKHPRMIAVRSEIYDLRRGIAAEVQKIVEGLRNEVAIARAREASIRDSLSTLRVDVDALGESEVQLRALEREAEANRALFETFLQRSKETGAQEGFEQADATILSLANLPVQPTGPNKLLLLAVVLLFASGAGVGVAFLMELVDNGFRSMEEIEEVVGVQALGLIPTIRRMGGAKTPPDYLIENPMSAYSEAIRGLYTGLLLTDVDDPPQVIMISSAMPREGKSTTTASLGFLLASVGRKVLVVDCDLRRPSMADLFEVDSKRGLTDFLAGDLALDEAIQRCEKSNAHVLPAGRMVSHPNELLASHKMRGLLKELRGRYEIVLLDSAPTLAVSDSRILSLLADQTVFIVQWAQTRRNVAVRGLRQLLDARAPVAGVALSMVDTRRHASYGYGDSVYYSSRVAKYYQGRQPA